MGEYFPGDAVPTTPSDLLMWPATLRTPTSPTTCAKPACPHCDGAGYYKEPVPFGHPHFGVLFPCVCKLAEQALFEIVETRYKHGRRTLITANIRRKDLSRRLASRIADMVAAEIWLVVSDLREIRLRERRRQRESAE